VRSQIPRPDEPIIDPKSGRPNKTWYRWFSLFSEDAAAIEGDAGVTPPLANPQLIEMQINAVQMMASALQTQMNSRFAQLEYAVSNLETQPIANTSFLLASILELEAQSAAVWAPLVTGETPGPVAIANPLGEFVMVRVR
jgi:hypothetical protein